MRDLKYQDSKKYRDQVLRNCQLFSDIKDGLDITYASPPEPRTPLTQQQIKDILGLSENNQYFQHLENIVRKVERAHCII